MFETVGRYAPSPSGRMHLGNAFAALCAWLFARSAGGSFLLRIEDLDPDRCKPEYAELVREDLRWLGLDWDYEGIPQSLRTDAYRAAKEKLEESGLIYPCYCSRGELHAASAPHASDGTYIYPGTCRNLSAAERLMKTRKPAWRAAVPARVIAFKDILQGHYEEELSSQCGDFIIQRADGVFAYQLAVVVDDAAMGVNQVVRGLDLLPSSARQLWLQEQLGFPHPQYAHVPLLCAEDGKRLSKREHSLSFDWLREHMRPEELVGILAFTAGITDEPEPAVPAELISIFRPDGLRKENIVIPTGFFDK